MIRTIGLAAATMLLAGGASAATFTYSSTVRADKPQELSSTYSFDDQTNAFGMTFDIDDAAGVDGAWWVVSNGPNPASTGATKLAILYTDLVNVWAYEYTGGYRRNDPAASGTLLEYYANAVSSAAGPSTGYTTYSVGLDATDLNSAATAANTTDPSGWEGLQFAEQIGTWLHPTIGAFDNCTNNTDAALNCFDGSNWIGWDEANRTTVVAPPPSPVPLSGSLGFAAAPLALMGFGAWRRRKAAAKA